jgi:hypothetical protein
MRPDAQIDLVVLYISLGHKSILVLNFGIIRTYVHKIPTADDLFAFANPNIREEGHVVVFLPQNSTNSTVC